MILTEKEIIELEEYERKLEKREKLSSNAGKMVAVVFSFVVVVIVYLVISA